MPLTTTNWDAADYLTSPEAEAAYLEAAFEDGDPALIAAAIGDIARARGMSSLAEVAGVRREALYRAFCKNGNPTLTTLTGTLKALGLRLSVERVEA